MDKKRHMAEKAGDDKPGKSARLEKQLEEGLEGTFPGSDALSVTQPVHYELPKKY